LEKAPAFKRFWQSKLCKACLIAVWGILIGCFDAWQACCMPIGSFGIPVAILYQVILIAASGALALFTLYSKSWSFGRNMLSLIVGVPISTIADNVSLDLQVMKPYVVILPSSGYLWRLQVFDHTPFYPLASWVDLQTFAPGLIDGYVAAIALAGLYVFLQSFWDRINFQLIVHALQSALFFRRHFPFRR
jgi:hypothetical protein